VKKQPSWRAAKGKVQSLVNIVADMYFILVLVFVEMMQYVHRKDRDFNFLPLLLKSATEVSRYRTVMLGFYGISFHSCPLPTIFRSMTVQEI
jgi:hypothetical protein